jgi:hypothetical protein
MPSATWQIWDFSLSRPRSWDCHAMFRSESSDLRDPLHAGGGTNQSTDV